MLYCARKRSAAFRPSLCPFPLDSGVKNGQSRYRPTVNFRALTVSSITPHAAWQLQELLVSHAIDRLLGTLWPRGPGPIASAPTWRGLPAEHGSGTAVGLGHGGIAGRGGLGDGQRPVRCPELQIERERTVPVTDLRAGVDVEEPQGR